MERAKNQKSARICVPKNRYYAGAKLSEHKFLRILRGYADGIPIQVLEPTTHTSGKTIRATYRTLRGGLVEAALAHPDRFGGAGHILVHAHADKLLHAVSQSRRFKRHVQRHAPRLSCPIEQGTFVTEKLVRLFCALDLRDVGMEENADNCAAIIDQLAKAIPHLHPREPVQNLADFIEGSKPHTHASLRLFEDYRRYLLKVPMGYGRSSWSAQKRRDTCH